MNEGDNENQPNQNEKHKEIDTKKEFFQSEDFKNKFQVNQDKNNSNGKWPKKEDTSRN